MGNWNVGGSVLCSAIETGNRFFQVFYIRQSVHYILGPCLFIWTDTRNCLGVLRLFFLCRLAHPIYSSRLHFAFFEYVYLSEKAAHSVSKQFFGICMLPPLFPDYPERGSIARIPDPAAA